MTKKNETIKLPKAAQLQKEFSYVSLISLLFFIAILFLYYFKTINDLTTTRLLFLWAILYLYANLINGLSIYTKKKEEEK